MFVVCNELLDNAVVYVQTSPWLVFENLAERSRLCHVSEATWQQSVTYIAAEQSRRQFGGTGLIYQTKANGTPEQNMCPKSTGGLAGGILSAVSFARRAKMVIDASQSRR